MSNDLELLVRAYVDQAQELDTAATALLVDTTIDAAAGVQLDGLGQIIGVGRSGLNDENYRALLRAYIRVNTRGVTIPEIVEIVRLALNQPDGTGFIQLVEGAPAEFEVTFTQALPVGRGLVAAEAIYQAKAAGVHGIFSYFETVTTPLFQFDGGSSSFDGAFRFKTAIRNRRGRESEIL